MQTVIVSLKRNVPGTELLLLRRLADSISADRLPVQEVIPLWVETAFQNIILGTDLLLP